MSCSFGYGSAKLYISSCFGFGRRSVDLIRLFAGMLKEIGSNVCNASHIYGSV